MLWLLLLLLNIFRFIYCFMFNLLSQFGLWLFMHFYNAREIMLYLCIHVVYLLGLNYSVALSRLVGRRGKGGRNTFWHSERMLPYWLVGLAEIKTQWVFTSQAAQKVSQWFLSLIGDSCWPYWIWTLISGTSTTFCILLLMWAHSESTLLSIKPHTSDCNNLF